MSNTDFLKKYKKQKILTNITIVIASLIIALGINFFVIDNSSMGNQFKANVLEVNNNEKKSDLYLENNSWKIILKNSKKLNKVTSISFSIIYNPENVKIKNISCIWDNIVEIWNEKWIKAIIVNFSKNKNIENNSEICKIQTIKNNNNSEQLNLINSNFTDNTWETYLLTTSGITF